MKFESKLQKADDTQVVIVTIVTLEDDDLIYYNKLDKLLRKHADNQDVQDFASDFGWTYSNNCLTSSNFYNLRDTYAELINSFDFDNM